MNSKDHIHPFDKESEFEVALCDVLHTARLGEGDPDAPHGRRTWWRIGQRLSTT